MGFCGGCGKKADSEDKFCTGCGAPISEAQVSVLEETGEVVKEEYRLSTTPAEVEVSEGTHIGDQKKEGEWLEHTVAHLLRYAGFETQREESFVFNDSTGDKFKIDVLASDPTIEIFVECKDYADLKMSEKIMYTLTGQLDDYRKRQSKSVIGILAMTAKDDGRNAGIRESLRKHNCFLWDGSFIEHLQNKMVEMNSKVDFRAYVLDHLDVFEAPEKKEGDLYDFMVKYSFFTISPREYVGKSFDIMNIIDEIKLKLPSNIKIVNFVSDSVKSEGKLISYNVAVDFSMKMDWNEIERLAKAKRKLMERIRRKKPQEIVYRFYKENIIGILSKVYGISYDPGKKKNMYFSITLEGGRLA